MKLVLKCLSLNLQNPNAPANHIVLQMVRNKFGADHTVVAFQGVGRSDFEQINDIFGDYYKISEYPPVSTDALLSSVILVSKSQPYDVLFDNYKFTESQAKYCGATFATLFDNKKKLIVLGSVQLDHVVHERSPPRKYWFAQTTELGELLANEPDCVLVGHFGFSDHQRSQKDLFKTLQGDWRDPLAPNQRSSSKAHFTNSPNRRDDRVKIKGKDISVIASRNHQECWNPEARDRWERQYVALLTQGRYTEAERIQKILVEIMLRLKAK